ncbi:isoprenoid synthase domain-containing protein [Cyathus striatus]|nr:isoprenoid synthase domain-containing protein [Cyathus striatus]
MPHKIVSNERCEKYEEIRSAVHDFLNRCGIADPRNIRVDPIFDEDCHAECIKRGYDMELLTPFLRVGIDIARTSYTHLKDKKLLRYIAIFTAFSTYLDDYCQSEAGMIHISSFLTRFVNNEPQEHKILDDLVSVLKEVNQYWPPITASLIFSAYLNFISAAYLHHETKNIQLGEYAIQYLPFFRRLSGMGETYSIFAFPPEMPACEFMHAVPDICDITNYGNDIMSFYKEELQGEKCNYISLFGKTHGLGKMESLKLVADHTVSAHERILNLLDGEANACYKSYSQGYVGFHALCERYKLDHLDM